MKAIELIEAIKGKLKIDLKYELAQALGVSQQTLSNWCKSNKDMTADDVAGLLERSRNAAIMKSQFHAIKPIIEFFEIERVLSKQQQNWELFPSNKEASTFQQGARKALGEAKGIYIFYDSRGQALYAGKTEKQSLWKEMNLAFNREREVQEILLVGHPVGNHEFEPGHQYNRQPTRQQLKLYDLAFYCSAYEIDGGIINDIEALLVRGFANDLLNMKMEKFQHARN
jgi:transcriptional regulator with XRE-family HTH domain